MEVKSEKDKQQLSSNDSSTYSTKSLKLGVCSKSRLKSTSATSIKLNRQSRDKMQASMSKKIKLMNIEVVSKNNRLSDPADYKDQISVSCFPELVSVNQKPLFNNYLEYNHLLSKLANSPTKQTQLIHGFKGQKLACFEDNCEIKRKWIRNIIFYEKQIKNVYLLKQRKTNSLSQQVYSQIEKDATRTFSPNVVTKIKINLVQSDVEKYNLIEILKNVLRLYAIYDSQVGYVQGMNMIAAPIVFHMKEVNAAFIYFKQVMTYGKLRLFFVDHFQNIKKEVHQNFKKMLRFYNIELYTYFEEHEIDYTMFIPFYFSLFSLFVEIQCMHIIINEFMKDGISFLHKFFLVLLLFLKERIVQDRQNGGLITKLGSSYIKSLDIDWKYLISLTKLINFT